MQGVQVELQCSIVLVVAQFFRIFEILFFFCFIVAIVDLVHDVET